MFEGCSRLTSLKESQSNTNQVKDMTKMFEYCKVSSLDISNLTSKIRHGRDVL